MVNGYFKHKFITNLAHCFAPKPVTPGQTEATVGGKILLQQALLVKIPQAGIQQMLQLQQET